MSSEKIIELAKKVIEIEKFYNAIKDFKSKFSTQSAMNTLIATCRSQSMQDSTRMENEFNAMIEKNKNKCILCTANEFCSSYTTLIDDECKNFLNDVKDQFKNDDKSNKKSK